MLVQSGDLDQGEELQEAIKHELESNPFWQKWKIDKVTILDEAGKTINPSEILEYQPDNKPR